MAQSAIEQVAALRNDFVTIWNNGGLAVTTQDHPTYVQMTQNLWTAIDAVLASENLNTIGTMPDCPTEGANP